MKRILKVCKNCKHLIEKEDDMNYNVIGVFAEKVNFNQYQCSLIQNKVVLPIHFETGNIPNECPMKMEHLILSGGK